MSDEHYRVLVVHNHYGDYAVGGEGSAMRAEALVLERYGHEVLRYERTNAELANLSMPGRINALWSVAWSRCAYEEIGRVLDRFRPDIMHVHNYWLLLTPSIFAAARERGVTTVLTLHNYRMVCPGGQFLYGGIPCEDCLDGKPYRVLWRRCKSGSLLKSLLALRMYLDSKARDFLDPLVDAYIALSDFAKVKFEAGGMWGEKIHVKPNFIEDPFHSGNVAGMGLGAVFAGRLSVEKGLPSLLEAWKSMPIPLTVVGAGPQMRMLRKLAPSGVEFTGQLSNPEVLECIPRSSFLALPSLCYEGFPMTILEAMALGRAVLASDLGPRREIVQHGSTGLLFRAGDVEDMRSRALQLIEDPDLCRRLGIQAREEYLKRYTPERNYQALMEVYRHARLMTP